MGVFYEGTHEGMTYQSIHPCLFRASYRWQNPASRRMVDSTVYVTAYDEIGARERITRRADVYGEIKVEFVMHLDRVER